MDDSTEQSAPVADPEYTALVPGQVVTLAGGERVVVRPFGFTQLGVAAKHIEGVMRPAMNTGVVTPEGDINLSALLGLLTAAGDHVNELLLLCTYGEDGVRVTREWLDGVSIEDGIELTRAAIEQNWREEIAKKLEALSGEIRAILNQDGSTSSKH